MKKILLILTIFALLIPINDIDARSKKAPGIALEDTNGKFTMLSSLVGKSNIVISFWSYDCVPCRKEMPELQKLSKEAFFKGKNVKLVYIYVEATTAKSKKGSESMPPKEKALEVLDNLDIKETCLLDIYGVAFNNYRKASRIKKTTLPLLYLINKKGRIVFQALGYSEKNINNLKKAIKKKL